MEKIQLQKGVSKWIKKDTSWKSFLSYKLTNGFLDHLSILKNVIKEFPVLFTSNIDIFIPNSKLAKKKPNQYLPSFVQESMGLVVLVSSSSYTIYRMVAWKSLFLGSSTSYKCSRTKFNKKINDYNNPINSIVHDR